TSVAALVLLVIWTILRLNKASRVTDKTEKKKEEEPPTETLAPTTTPAKEEVKAKPKAKDSLSGGGIGVLLGVVAIVMYGIYSIVTTVASIKPSATKPAVVTTVGARWDEPQTLKLSGQKVCVPWQNGVVRYETHLAKGENLSRRYWLKSGDRQALFGEEDGGEGLEICFGKPLYLWSADGKPLNVIFQWKLK
ncbi:MAG: hypothetical protein NT041_00960, partial [Candidatus Vogelbacteria bacterium]|nr:hypothetical protein [Candidatus Vogelbacteria bacterium]